MMLIVWRKVVRNELLFSWEETRRTLYDLSINSMKSFYYIFFALVKFFVVLRIVQIITVLDENNLAKLCLSSSIKSLQNLIFTSSF